MTTTSEGAFREFKSNLEISGLQKSTVSSRQQSVRDAVSKELSVSDSFLAGSYSRSTIFIIMTVKMVVKQDFSIYSKEL
jgi:hypothetical protein